MTATIGFVGLGVMGTAIAGRILDAGYELVVYNRTPQRARQLVARGAALASTPAEVARRSHHVFSCLLDKAAIESVCLGCDGLVPELRPGQIVVEHATFPPAAARRLASLTAERGASYLDAPVTGGPEGAMAGNLTAMVGGRPDALAEVSDVMSCYTKDVVHVGEPGRGLELKLVNQLLVSSHLAAAAEAAALIRVLRLPMPQSEQVLMSGWASSQMLGQVLPKAATGDFTDRGATIGALADIQSLVASLAGELALDLTVFEAARERFARAVATGLGVSDPAALTLTYDAGMKPVSVLPGGLTDPPGDSAP